MINRRANGREQLLFGKIIQSGKETKSFKYPLTLPSLYGLL